MPQYKQAELPSLVRVPLGTLSEHAIVALKYHNLLRIIS